MPQALFTPPEDEVEELTPSRNSPWSPPASEVEEFTPDTALGSFARGLKHRALAGLGGLAGGIGAGALVPGLGETGISEAVGGVIGLGAGLLGGEAGGAAGEWLNQKLLGPEGIAREKAQMEANRLAGHEFAGSSGEMVADILPAMKRGGLPATTTLGKLGHSAEAFARMGGASEAAHQVETGEFDPKALVTHPLESAITGAAVGLVPGMSIGAKYFGQPAAEVLGSVLGKAPTDAAVLTLSGQLYNHFVHGAPLSMEGVTDETGKAIPGFMLLNALTGVAGLPGALFKAREQAKKEAPPPAADGGLHMQGFEPPADQAEVIGEAPEPPAAVEPVAPPDPFTPSPPARKPITVSDYDDATLDVKEQELAQKENEWAVKHSQTNDPYDRMQAEEVARNVAQIRAEKARRSTAKVVEPVAEENAAVGNPLTAAATAKLSEDLAKQQQIESMLKSQEDQADLMDVVAKEREKADQRAAKEAGKKPLPEMPKAPEPAPVEEPEPAATTEPIVPRGTEEAPIPSEKAPTISEKIAEPTPRESPESAPPKNAEQSTPRKELPLGPKGTISLPAMRMHAMADPQFMESIGSRPHAHALDDFAAAHGFEWGGEGEYVKKVPEPTPKTPEELGSIYSDLNTEGGINQARAKLETVGGVTAQDARTLLARLDQEPRDNRLMRKALEPYHAVEDFNDELAARRNEEPEEREPVEEDTNSPDARLSRLEQEDGFDDAMDQYWQEMGEAGMEGADKTYSAEKAAKESGEILTPQQAMDRRDEWYEKLREIGRKRGSENGQKIILSLFDRTGKWAEPFLLAGYDVRAIDLEIDDVNVMDINHDWLANYDMGIVHGILCANPCTDFAVSGARWWKDKDADGRTEASVALAKHTLAIVEYLKPSFWALENPVGRIAELTGIGNPRLQFQPSNFGDPYTKRTQIWGNFNPELPLAPVEPTEGSKMHKLRGDDPRQKAMRSDTPEGFAAAFALANSNHGPAERVAEILKEHKEGGAPSRAGGAWQEGTWEMINEQRKAQGLEPLEEEPDEQWDENGHKIAPKTEAPAMAKEEAKPKKKKAASKAKPKFQSDGPATEPENAGGGAWELLSFKPQAEVSHDEQQRLNSLQRGLAIDPRTRDIGLKVRVETPLPVEDQRGVDSAEPGSSAAALASIEAFTAATGKRVVFISDENNHPLPFNAVTMPEHPDTIFVNKNASRHLMALVGHEWGHTIKKTHPMLYAAFEREAMRQLGEHALPMMEKVEANDYDSDQLREEVSNNVIGDVFLQPEFWNNLKEHNRPLWRRMVAAVEQWMSGLVQKFRKSEFGTTEVVKSIEETRKAVAELMHGSLEKPAEPSEPAPAPRPAWQQSVKEMQEANKQGEVLAHQVSRPLDDLLAGRKKAIVLNGIKDERAAIALGNTLGFRVAELPNKLGWIGYLEPDAWRPVYEAYAKNLMVEGQHAHLDPMAHSEIAKAMGVDQAEIDDFYRGMLKKHGLEFSADKEEGEEDADPGKGMTVADIVEQYAEWKRKAPGGRPYMNMDDTTRAAHVELLRNPEKPQELANAILSDNHKATPREKALMAVAVVQLHNIIEARAGDPGNIALYDKLDNLYRAYRLDSSSWGQEGNVIQRRIKKDYTPAGLMRRVRMATGKEPTSEMRAKIEQFAKEFAAATEQEKQDAFSYTKKVAHELMEKLEQEQKAREEESSHWLDEAMESLDDDARKNVDGVLLRVSIMHELDRLAQSSGLKFSSDTPIERTAANKARADQVKAYIASLGPITQEVLTKTKEKLNAEIAKLSKAFVDPRVKEDIKKAVGGDKVALKLLDDLSKQPKAKPVKAPDPVKKRFADEVRQPGDKEKFAQDMQKLGVKPDTATKLHDKAKEKRATMVKRKFAKDKSSESAMVERDDDAPLSIGEITQALRDQGVSHVSEVDTSLLGEAMRTLVAHGHRGEAEVMPELHKLVKDAGIAGDVDEVREAAVSYGAPRKPPSPEELDEALRHVKSEAQKMAQIMHVLHNAELPSGFGPLRDKPHQKLRELYKQLKDVIKNAGVKLRSSKDQLASAEDATLTRLRNDIEDLQAQIDTGARKIRDKSPMAHTPEFTKKQEALKAKKVELQEALESIAPRKGEDEAERERRLIAAAGKVAKHWEERRKNAEWEDKTPNKVSQAVKDARKIASDSKELFEQAKDAARPDFKVGERIKMRQKQIDSLIQKARERLAFGKRQAKDNSVFTAEAEADSQALIDELQRLRVEIEGRPGMSDEQRLKNAENSAQKAVEMLKKQIDANDFTAKDKKAPVNSAKLADLRQELDLLREVRDAMKYKERPSDEELAIKRYSRLLDRRTADLERRIRDKDFSKVERKKTPENFENSVKKLAIAKLQRRFNTMVKEEVDKNRTPLEKFYDYIPKLKRAFVLSYPAVVGKLTAAAAMRGLTTMSEELVSGALSKVLPRELVKKAEIEGGMLSATGWSKAIARWWEHVGKDVKDTVKEGSSDLDDLFGKGGHENDWWGFFGRIHAALKAPVKRLRFEMAMEKQAEAYQRGGGDPTDLITNPLLAAKTGAKAYQAANRDIFLQDNILVDRYTTFVNLLASAKGTAGPTTARFLRTLLPIVKVPTNIVLETSQHIAGVPIALARLGHIWQRGMETITPEESESIMRMMKKGSLGAGLMLLGFYAGGPNFAAGGYYSHDDKRKPGDPKVGGFKVFGMDVPTWMTHAPAFEAIQVGATFRRGLNSHQHTKSIPSAALASMVGLAEETPFLNEIFRSKYMTTAKGQEQFIGELAKAQIEPGLLSQIAQWTDRSRPLKPADLLTGEGQQKRKPNGFAEIMKSGIPGMRKGLSYTVDSPFSPREEHAPEVLNQYAQKGNPMPTTPTRAPLEKKQGRPISNEMWNAYTDIRGRAVEREMLANIGFLMAPMSEKAKKQKVMEIARKASYEATQALGLK